MSRRRVVVTGMGLLSPIGNTVESAWQAALGGQSGIGLIDSFDASEFSVKIAGNVKDFDVADYMSVKEARRMDRFIQLGIAAAVQAIEDAGLESEAADADRIGVAIGSGIGGIQLLGAGGVPVGAGLRGRRYLHQNSFTNRALPADRA